MNVETVTTALGIAGPVVVGALFLEADTAARKAHVARSMAWLCIYPALALAAALPRWAAREDLLWQSLAWAGWAATGALGLVAARRARAR